MASVHSPFAYVVCRRLLVAPPSLKARAERDRVCELLSGGSLTLKPAPSAFPSIVEKGHRRKEGKKHYQLLSPCPTAFLQLIHVTVQVTLRLQCGDRAATADEVDLLTEAQRYAITWGKQSGDDGKTVEQISTAVVKSFVEHDQPPFPCR